MLYILSLYNSFRGKLLCHLNYEIIINLFLQKRNQLPKLHFQIEGTTSQATRIGLRRSRYKNLKKTHLQEIAGAVALNFSRLAAWFNNTSLAMTRRSNFGALASTDCIS